ncbi:MAG: inositol monophosphatase family protein [Nocardioides sp.]
MSRQLNDVELAMAAASAGAAEVRMRYAESHELFAKGVHDFATEADLASEQAIRAMLHDLRPDDAVTGEEVGTTGAGAGGREWLVDPLCGTRNYAVRTTLVAVNVALRTPDGVLAAASIDPLSGETFWDRRDRGLPSHPERRGADGPVRILRAGGLLAAADQATHASLVKMLDP